MTRRRGLKNNYIGTEHLLLGLIREEKNPAAQVLTDLGVTLEGARLRTAQLQHSEEPPGNSPHGRNKRFQALAANIASLVGEANKEASKPSEELLSLDEAVKFLGTSKPTLYRLLGQDEIKGLKVGRQWRFRRADLIAYMERGPVAVAAAPKEDLDMELAFFAEQLPSRSRTTRATPKPRPSGSPHRSSQLAIQSRASDIHLEPNADDFLLRLRVDGVLQETRRLPSSMRESLTARFKTMAEMDTNEKRLPQDGRIPVRHDGKDFDFRVAVVPSMYGEAVTMRILDRSTVLLGLDKLGIAPEDLQPDPRPCAPAQRHRPRDRADRQRENDAAVFLPPGSRGVEKKTLTVEDPVEFALPYTTQTQVNKKAGLTFPGVLRSFLRQDPDVILVSEMRDLETAQIAVEVSLTGHLLLTSLHTGDAPSALLRLLDMGVEPYLISATVAGVVATRLVRRVCDNCKQPVDLSAGADPGLCRPARRRGRLRDSRPGPSSCAGRAASSAGGGASGAGRACTKSSP